MDDSALTEEYFEPKEENFSETGNQDNLDLKQKGNFNLDISDDESNDDNMLKTNEQNHSYLCPIKSCTFVMSCYDETTKNTHIETHHGEINLADVCFIKL